MLAGNSYVSQSSQHENLNRKEINKVRNWNQSHLHLHLYTEMCTDLVRVKTSQEAIMTRVE